jgi:hypothetical protein
MRFLLAIVLLAVGTCAGGHFISNAEAGTIPYPSTGTINPVTYTFTAEINGDVTAYFAGTGATYIDTIGMLVNGSPTGVFGLDNQTSTIGQSVDLGSVAAGNVLTFVLNVDTSPVSSPPPPYTLYSNPSLNTGGFLGLNQVYATTFAGGVINFPNGLGNPSCCSGAYVPAGVYLGFEDSTDYNYTDEQVVLTDTAVTATPLPAALPLFAGGLGLMGLFAKRKRDKQEVKERQS